MPNRHTGYIVVPLSAVDQPTGEKNRVTTRGNAYFTQIEGILSNAPVAGETQSPTPTYEERIAWWNKMSNWCNRSLAALEGMQQGAGAGIAQGQGAGGAGGGNNG